MRPALSWAVGVPEHPLAGLWLSRSSLVGAGVDPLGSILDLDDRADADRMGLTRGKRFETNFADYLRLRVRVERWLRDSAAALGVADLDRAPLYFQLLDRPWPHAKPGRTTINLPAGSIRPGCCTFTLGDSFDCFSVRDGRPFETAEGARARVLSAAEVVHHLESVGLSLDPDVGRHYVECQVWSRSEPVFDQVRQAFPAATDAAVLTFDRQTVGMQLGQT